MGFIQLLLFDRPQDGLPSLQHTDINYWERKTNSTSPVVGGTGVAAGLCCCWWFPLGTRGTDAAGLSVEAGLSVTSRARPRPTEGHKGKN